MHFIEFEIEDHSQGGFTTVNSLSRVCYWEQGSEQATGWPIWIDPRWPIVSYTRDHLPVLYLLTCHLRRSHFIIIISVIIFDRIIVIITGRDTVPHGCLVATLCTLWHCDLDLWHFDLTFIGERGIVMDYPCVKFDDFSFSRFGFNARTDRQTDRQTHRQNHGGGWSLYRRRQWIGLITTKAVQMCCIYMKINAWKFHNLRGNFRVFQADTQIGRGVLAPTNLFIYS